ncbi:hypothetical protein M7I_1379 [Glarea lozoyensis 74030]|uniref:Uncharacterized protein n=1 Tax=Glarea lozoyensis (strain ATCC 74030 / MF5533) TaxID=1104152 RepID=H0EFX1_GLAL7|nr:hypothetical protein M7I_1379 [Glarea lozoyensis 74030]
MQENTPTTNIKTTATPADKRLLRDLFGTSSPATALSPDSTPSKSSTSNSVLSKELPGSGETEKVTSFDLDKVTSDQTAGMVETISTAKTVGTVKTDSTPKPTTSAVPEANAQISNILENEDTNTALNQENKGLSKLPKETEKGINHEVEDAPNSLSLDPYESGFNLLNQRMAEYCAQNPTPDCTKQEHSVKIPQPAEDATDTITVNPELFIPQKRKSTSPPPSDRKAKVPRTEFVVPEAKMTASPSPMRTSTKVSSSSGSTKQIEEHSDTAEDSKEILSIRKMLSSVNELLRTTKKEAVKSELNIVLSATSRHLEVDINSILKKHGILIRKQKKLVL